MSGGRACSPRPVPLSFSLVLVEVPKGAEVREVPPNDLELFLGDVAVPVHVKVPEHRLEDTEGAEDREGHGEAQHPSRHTPSPCHGQQLSPSLLPAPPGAPAPLAFAGPAPGLGWALDRSPWAALSHSGPHWPWPHPHLHHLLNMLHHQRLIQLGLGRRGPLFQYWGSRRGSIARGTGGLWKRSGLSWGQGA